MNANATYDPFTRGPFHAGVRTLQLRDSARGRDFPCEVWYPSETPGDGQDSPAETRDADARPGTYPLVLFSHSSGAGRRSATFLCTHLAGHGYVVAALDHSELVAPELARREGETEEQKRARWEALAAGRLDDARFLLDQMLGGAAWDAPAVVDSTRVGLVGHSLGGWTALATAGADSRVGAVVALAPGGASRTKPGILPLRLSFDRWRDVPTLYLAAEGDTSLPLDGIRELHERTPSTAKRLVVLRRADHLHFMDDVERLHEAVRAMAWPGDLSWLPKEMRPISELCTGEQSHLFTRSLTLAHLDATLRGIDAAQRLLVSGLEDELASRGVELVALAGTS